MSDVVRYAPQRAFPAYAFVPGRNPHPIRDPRGHSFGQRDGPVPHICANRWRENEAWLAGVDLYNHGYLWEAHEAWERPWLGAREDVAQELVLQGLIQCAASVLKIAMGEPAGARRLADLGLEKLDDVAAHVGGRYMGVDLARFAAEFRAFAASEPSSIDGRPILVLA